MIVYQLELKSKFCLMCEGGWLNKLIFVIRIYTNN